MSGALEEENARLRAELESTTRQLGRALIGLQKRAHAAELVRQQKEDLEERNSALAAKEDENQELVMKLREAVRQLSTPVLQVGSDILALVIVGSIDEDRAAQMTEQTLAGVVEKKARCLILDITGVEEMDHPTADHVFRLARAVRLLGAQCILTGIQPRVAETVVNLQLEIGGIQTARTLHDALERVTTS